MCIFCLNDREDKILKWFRKWALALETWIYILALISLSMSCWLCGLRPITQLTRAGVSSPINCGQYFPSIHSQRISILNPGWYCLTWAGPCLPLSSAITLDVTVHCLKLAPPHPLLGTFFPAGLSSFQLKNYFLREASLIYCARPS